MAIVKMNKFSLLAFESQKHRLLDELQGLEGVQFINLQQQELQNKHEVLFDMKKDSPGEKFSFYEEAFNKIKFSMDFLTPYLEKKSAIKSFMEGKKLLTFDELNNKMKDNRWESIYSELKSKEEELNALSNEGSKMKTEIGVLSLWKNFDAPFRELKSLKFTSYYLGTISKQYEEAFLKDFNGVDYGNVEILNGDNQDIYLFALVYKEEEKAEEILKKYGFSSFTFTYEERPVDIIESYKSRLKEIDLKVEKLKSELSKCDEKKEELEIAYDYFNNNLLREKAADNFLKTEKVVVISGWNTVESNEVLNKVISNAVEQDYYLSFSEVSEDEIEEVPIKLKNNGFASAFENIVEMYSMPSYKEVDPTPILSVFYFVFFGMMLSDAGYGVVMVVASILALTLGKDKEKKKPFKLFLFAGISTIIWGSIYGGWFGDLFPVYLGIKVPYLLEPTSGVTKIFVMSLVFGIIHIFIGLGIKAYMLIRNNQIKDAIYDVLTWYLAIIGGILLIVKVGGSIGKYMLIIGMIGLLLTQGRSAPTIGGKIGGGIYGAYGITGYLGDIVSYSRLLALGLATGFIANALNLIISLVPKPFSYVLAPIMFVGLHLFNMTINALGSYVHAARLQYLEFFGKFYEGGGKKFNPFKTSDKYVKIVR